MTDARAFVLAGGQSSRMGQDKAFLPFAGTTLLERALSTARAVVPQVRIVGSKHKFQTFAATIEDQFPAHGPLGGIHAALTSSSCGFNLILAVDMPFLDPRWLTYLLEQSRNSSATVTLARTQDGWQPLCAVYRPDFASLAEPALRAGRNRIGELFSHATLRVIDERELAAHDFSSEMFRNLNTPAEFNRAALGNAIPESTSPANATVPNPNLVKKT
jgi:molybdopterin-guanine dinucleotide biosynthesis protein A